MNTGLLFDGVLALIALIALLTIWRQIEADDAAQRSMDWEVQKNTDEWEIVKAERTLWLVRDEQTP